MKIISPFNKFILFCIESGAGIDEHDKANLVSMGSEIDKHMTLFEVGYDFK